MLQKIKSMLRKAYGLPSTKSPNLIRNGNHDFGRKVAGKNQSQNQAGQQIQKPA
jgi:hypothetical protein